VRVDTSIVGDMASTLSGPSMQPFFAWDEGGNGLFTATQFGAGVHEQPNPDGLNENLASDPATGQVYLAIVRLNHVITIERLDSTAAPTGSAFNLPSFGSNVPDDPVGRIAVTGRPGGGVYLADAFGSPSARFVGLWRIGGSSVTEIADIGAGHDAIAGVSATLDGRIWVFWRGANGHVFARRSNPQVTRFGAVVDAGEPGVVTFAPVGNATPDGGLDLITVAASDTSGATALYYTRILPVLTISESKRTVKEPLGKSVKDTFTVTDAGAPVRGVTVHVGSRHAETGANGQATLKLPAERHSKTVIATATAARYLPARIPVKIKVL
jgi:hypothetical protein